MLSRPVCYKCVEACGRRITPNCQYQMDGWKVFDDLNWNNSHNVLCPEGVWARIDECPPAWCEHKFEHGIAVALESKNVF